MLLDTHAAVWLAEGDYLSPRALDAIGAALVRGALLVSAVTAWEIALLHDGGRRLFEPSPEQWFAEFAEMPGLSVLPLDWRTALNGQLLPAPFQRDPADRFLVATARERGVPILTRDRNILDYAAAGHVLALPC
jgi:PIN domain nuclease of toxin-antitoxin system